MLMPRSVKLRGDFLELPAIGPQSRLPSYPFPNWAGLIVPTRALPESGADIDRFQQRADLSGHQSSNAGAT
ncbi:hypothetical protein [Mesorhizobium sp. M0910]|uniref:hypothetical protein n=1 Tax=Mesorhizobium sp. M0910 TaxID=2957025 RepID=UPI00333DF570